MEGERRVAHGIEDTHTYTHTHTHTNKQTHKHTHNIRGELQGQGTSVPDRTISRCLSQSRPRRTPLLKANHMKAKMKFATMHMTKPQGCWENVLWKDEAKLELVSFKLFHI